MAAHRALANSDLRVSPLCLGGNVFGWTADQRASFEVLDAYVASGGNFVDTADQYSLWVPGHVGGESESMIGRWLAARGKPDDLVLATKVGHTGEFGKPGGLTAARIKERTEASLKRLQVDQIDLLYAHYDDLETPLVETLTAFDDLVRQGKVRYIGASNYSAERLKEARRISMENSLVAFTCLQTHYNILERDRYEGALAETVKAEGMHAIPYWALAKGFLTGKYNGSRPANDFSERASSDHFRVVDYDTERSRRILGVIQELAGDHGVTPAAIALAWTVRQPTIVSALASARTAAQVPDLAAVSDVTLSTADLAALDEVSEAGATADTETE